MKRSAPIDSSVPPSAKKFKVEGVRGVKPTWLFGYFAESTTVDQIMLLITSLPYALQKKVITHLTPLGLIHFSRYPQMFDPMIFKLLSQAIDTLSDSLSSFVDQKKDCKPTVYGPCSCNSQLLTKARTTFLYPCLEKIAERQELEWRNFKKQNTIQANCCDYHVFKAHAKQMLEPSFSGPDAFMKYQLDRIGPILEIRHFRCSEKIRNDYPDGFWKDYNTGFSTWKTTKIYGFEKPKKCVTSLLSEFSNREGTCKIGRTCLKNAVSFFFVFCIVIDWY